MKTFVFYWLLTITIVSCVSSVILQPKPPTIGFNSPSPAPMLEIPDRPTVQYIPDNYEQAYQEGYLARQDEIDE